MEEYEIYIQKEIEEYLDNKRIFHFRPGADSTKAGLPDIVACYQGRFIALELKRPKTGSAQGHQKIVSREIAKNGGITAFPRSLDEVEIILREVDRDVSWQK
jgi:Holliday junction resolvase